MLIESPFVVVSALRYLDDVIGDPADEAVFLIDASGSEPRPVATELLRFADALVVVASNVLDESVHPSQHLAILLPAQGSPPSLGWEDWIFTRRALAGPAIR